MTAAATTSTTTVVRAVLTTATMMMTVTTPTTTTAMLPRIDIVIPATTAGWTRKLKTVGSRRILIRYPIGARVVGTTRVVVLDNLLEGVLTPDIYDPTLNPLYRDMLAHYGVVALPCRVRDPDRKGKVEL